MDDKEWLAQRFEDNRAHLRAVAYRMLGSMNEAEDAVQETWIRLSRTDSSEVDNLGGWLTTAVSRVCLDMLRSRKSRREDLAGDDQPEPASGGGVDPEREALLADTMGPALLVVLETLAPAERLSFVLHDMFAVSFEEIGIILDRSPAAVRQLASRARRRVQGSEPVADGDLSLQRQVVDAFLNASRNGDFAALLSLLDPNVVFRGDATAVKLGGPSEMRGAMAVAGSFNGRAEAAHLAFIDGTFGAIVSTPGGKAFIALTFTLADGKVVGIDAIADPQHLKELEWQLS